MSSQQSRRGFLVQAAGLLAAPLVLSSGCGRRGAAPQGGDQAAAVIETANLDDLPEAATFRPPLPATEPVIRVRVLKARHPSLALRIGDEGQWIAVAATGQAAGKGIALQGPLQVAMDSSGWSIADGRGFAAGFSAREVVQISALEDAAAALLSVQEIPDSQSAVAATQPGQSLPATQPQPRLYPGTLRLVPRYDLAPMMGGAVAGFDLVNDVPIEAYLPGVLAGELYKHWQEQTFAAQAVAARSFAATEAAVFAGKRHYDVSNTAASQMYLGSVGALHSRAHEAVAMTRGLVLGYQNLLVSGYYSSCCGGAAASAIDAIGSNPVNDTAPLQGRSGSDVCTDAPVYQWKVEHPIEVLSRRLIAFGQERRIKELIGFTRLESIDVIAVNANGRPTRMRVMDDRQTAVEMTAENFRRAANYSGQGLNPPDKPLRSSYLRAGVSRAAVMFEGNGYGHGVGLCQYGAEALARSGMEHRDILAWYYPGAELLRAYT